MGTEKKGINGPSAKKTFVKHPKRKGKGKGRKGWKEGLKQITKKNS